MSPVPLLPDDLDGAQLAVEVAWGADLTAPADTWTWSDITEDVRYEDGPIGVTLGRSDEASESQPAECSMVLDNASGAYSLGPQSPNYPNVRRNTPVRVQAITGLGLDLPGDGVPYANTSDAAALNVGDLDVRIELTHNTWRPRAEYEVLAAKYLTTGEQRSWAVMLTNTGRLLLLWSHDGTFGGALNIDSTPVPEDSGRMALRCTLDVDDGAGGFAYAFYTGPSLGGPWTLLEGGTVSGTTSIFPSTADLTVGAGHGGNTIYTAAELLDGVVHGFELRDGINGPVVANPNFEATRSDYGVSTFTGDDGLIWNLSGDAKFVDPTRFFGYATGFTPSWNLKGNVPTVSLAANGVLRRLQQRKSPVVSALTRYLSTLTTPVAYWSLEEGKASRYGKPTIGTAAFEFVQNPDLDPPEGKITWAGADDNPATIQAPEIASGGALFAEVDPITLNGNSGWTLTWAQRFSSQSGAQSIWRTADFTVSMTIFTDGSLEVYLATDPLSSTTIMTYAFGPNDFDDIWHYYALTVRDDAGSIGVFLYVDGVQVGGHLEAGVPHANLQKIEFYAPFNTTEPTSIAQVSVLPRDDFNSVRDALAVAHAAHAGENAIDRLTRLCGEHGVPLTVTGTSTATMGPQWPDTFLALVRECETADQGVLYDGAGPGLAYVSRDRRENARPTAIIDVGGAELAPEFAPVDDDQRNVNQVVAQQREGSTAVYEDTDGPLGTATIGLYDGDIDVNISDAARLRDYASWLVHLGTVEGYRYPSVSLNMRATPHLAGPWQGVGPSARVDLVGTATALDNHEDTDIPLLVEGIEQSISPREWTVTAMSSLYRPWQIIVLAADTGDTDPNLSHLDTSGSELVSSVAAGATSLTVVATEGPPWTTLADDFPFEIEVGGFVVNVTGISGGGWAGHSDGFEDGIDDWVVRTGGASLTLSTDRARSGAASAKVEPDGSSSTVDVELTQLLPTVEGQEHTVRFWVFAESSSGGIGPDGINPYVAWYDASKDFMSASGRIAAVLDSGAWTEFTHTATAPAGAAYAGVWVRANETSLDPADTFYIDDVQLTGPPQTFTVDPVPRALPAGAPIQVHDPPVLGL